MRAIRILLAVTAAGSASLTFGAASGMAATPSTDYGTNFTRFESPDPQMSGRWSERLATVPDLTGDGKNEILIADLNETYTAGGTTYTHGGKVYMQDGATRNIMYSITSPEPQPGVNFGFYISVIGDVNGDGKADFAAGTDGQNLDATTGGSCVLGTPTCNYRAGKAWVFSGVNGQMLYALNDPIHQAAARFGSRIGRAGDVNGDGVQDIIVGASGTDMPVGCAHKPGGTDTSSSTIPATGTCRNGEGAAYVFSGKDGSLLRTLNLPAADEAPAPCSSSCGGLGLAVQGFGDVNGDGVVDHLVDASSFNYDTKTGNACTATTLPADCNKGQGAEYIFNGKTGNLIRRTDDPAPQAGATFGFQDAEPLAPGDVNGDGVPDYYANGFGQNGPNGEDTAGRAWVFSGKDGSTLYEVKDPTPAAGGQFGWSMTKTNYNKDGTPDLYVGQSPHHVGGTDIDQSGGTYVFNGKDGSLLKSLELPVSDKQSGATGNNGSNLGWAIAAPGDLNGDGEPDYVAGAPFEDVGPSGFNCQSNTDATCVQDVGREYFFYSNMASASPGQTSSGLTAPADTTAPGVSRFGILNNPFVVSGAKTPLFGFAAKHRKGTVFTYTLSEPATARIVIFQRRSGRRRGIRCVAPRRSLRKKAKCTRLTRRGTLLRVSKAGRNRVAFSGRIGSKALSPGSYSATITATDAAKNTSTPKTISFTIVKR